MSNLENKIISKMMIKVIITPNEVMQMDKINNNQTNIKNKSCMKNIPKMIISMKTIKKKMIHKI